jgi:hypothetical protein
MPGTTDIALSWFAAVRHGARRHDLGALYRASPSSLTPQAFVKRPADWLRAIAFSSVD